MDADPGGAHHSAGGRKPVHQAGVVVGDVDRPVRTRHGGDAATPPGALVVLEPGHEFGRCPQPVRSVVPRAVRDIWRRGGSRFQDPWAVMSAPLRRWSGSAELWVKAIPRGALCAGRPTSRRRTSPGRRRSPECPPRTLAPTRPGNCTRRVGLQVGLPARGKAGRASAKGRGVPLLIERHAADVNLVLVHPLVGRNEPRRYRRRVGEIVVLEGLEVLHHRLEVGQNIRR